MCSQQLHLTLPEELLRRYQHLAERHNFKNVQAVILSVLGRFSRRAEQQERQDRPVRLSIEDELDDMFNELSNIHLTPADTPPPRQHRPRKSQIEKGHEKGGEK